MRGAQVGTVADERRAVPVPQPVRGAARSPKARPETTQPEPPPQTGIDYLALTAAAHHEQLRRDERIGYHALYGQDGEIPGQLSIDDLQPGLPTPAPPADQRDRHSPRSATTLRVVTPCQHREHVIYA